MKNNKVTVTAIRTISLMFLTVILTCPQWSMAGDSTSFNPLPVSIEGKGVGGVPVGTIIAWPVARNPADWDNWLECNGQAIDPTVYPELFAVVGGRVPDLRGLFLRGQGGNAAALGTVQGDAIRNITAFSTALLYELDTWKLSGALYYASTSYSGVGLQGGKSKAGMFGFDASRVVPVASENRPVNRAVRYLVRAR